MADNLRLAVMTFPQRWNAATATLDINVMLVPSANPVADPLLGSASPMFADNAPAFSVTVIPNLDSVPKSTDPTALPPIVPTISDPSPVVAPRANYNALVAQAAALSVTVSGTGALTTPSGSTIRKGLPQSYLNATGARAGGATAGVDEFGCAVRGQTTYQAPPKPPSTTVGWGPMLSFALRQPVLATKLGLRYVMHAQLPAAHKTALNGGGWVFVTLAKTDAWSGGVVPAGPIRLYAARIPELTASRQLFAALLFPVDAVGPIADDAFSVAETYDDGFAQIVHLNEPLANNAVLGQDTTMPAPSSIGIQIGWDDEQVTKWHNDQIALMNSRMSGGLDAQTPLGVLGYRIDVADVTSSPSKPSWHSLVVANVTLPAGFGSFHGELAVEPLALRPQDPSQPNVVSGDAWLPLYFANWHGGSIAMLDPVLPAMLSKTPITATPDPVGVLLSYGRTYQFRVRVADLSSGGPLTGDDPVNIDPADTAAIDFLRTVPPKQPLVRSSGLEPASLTFKRPLMGYPEVLFTSLGDTDAKRGKIVEHFTQISNPGSGTVVGLPDPDVQALEITVEVRTPIYDVAGEGLGALDPPFRVLYTTTRPMPALSGSPIPTDSGLTIDMAYVDAPTILNWDASQASSGPLCIPRARDVRITARAVTKNDPTYFSAAAMSGLPATVIVRAESRTEPSLLIRSVDGSAPLRALLFQRPPGVDAPTIAAQLAQELDVAVDGLTLRARPGARIAFGASKGVRHTLPGDNSSITFASESELLRSWLAVLVVDLERDWTWDGLDNNDTIGVSRDGSVVGTLQVVRTLGSAATADPVNWDRARTKLIFFDAVDPHETTASGFPEETLHTWRLQATRKAETGAVVGVAGSPKLKPGPTPPAAPELNGVDQPITLPIAVPPSQMPAVASVGVALSPFAAGPGYASTASRSRSLWFEFEKPVANAAGDALFARVLAHGADPLLYSAIPTAAPNDPPPPLVLDPEFMRVITPGESDDRSGLDAMTMLEHAQDSDRHFLLPLPAGVDPSDPELFGFYTYEFRIGHAGDPHAKKWWSTAQARFGRPLRVSGVQHPAPSLVCNAGRITEVIGASPDVSPFAKNVPSNLLEIVSANVAKLRSRVGTIPVHDAVRLASFILATATYATPVLDGKPLVSPWESPRTSLYFFLYAQVVQADTETNRNVLLFQRPGVFFGEQRFRGAAFSFFGPTSSRDRVGGTVFSEVEVEDALGKLGLPTNLPLSVLAVEFLPAGGDSQLASEDAADPLKLNTNPQRILRTSPLVPVAAVC